MRLWWIFTAISLKLATCSRLVFLTADPNPALKCRGWLPLWPVRPAAACTGCPARPLAHMRRNLSYFITYWSHGSQQDKRCWKPSITTKSSRNASISVWGNCCGTLSDAQFYWAGECIKVYKWTLLSGANFSCLLPFGFINCRPVPNA